jgi:UDPglucose--hexose-1-phosphate uridylyltransferase
LSAPEIRIDQLTGLRTILAPGRGDRPHGFGAERSEDAKGAEGCPFCEGAEGKTPPEVYALRPGGGEPDTPGWTSRVVPNLYPALGDVPGADGPDGGTGPGTSGGDATVRGARSGDAGAFASAGDPLLESRRAGEPDLFAARPAVGGHEVIVNAPEHVTAMAELSEERFAGAIATWRERMRAHSEAAYVQVVVNEGAGAGASLPHTHAQLYALPFVPAAVARERERAGAYGERTAGGGLLADVLVEEVRRRERLVAIDEEAALICPWASRSPYELRVVPRRAAARFDEDEGGATMIRTAMRALAERFDGPPELNLWVATAPRGADAFHWHVDIAPKLTVKAGFELGAGVDINVYPPERAASDLREALGG